MKKIPIRNEKKSRNEIVVGLGLITQIGLTLAITMYISIMLGQFIDKKLNTTPLFILIFIVLGVASSFKQIYDMAMKYGKK